MHICVLVLKNIRITFWVLGWCGFITRKYDINKNKSDVEITKILLLVPGIHQWSGVCNKFPQPSTSDIWSTLYSGIKYAPLVVRAASLSTVSSSSLSAKRVPTRTWPRSQVAGPPCVPLSVPRFLPPPMPPFPPEENILLFFSYMFWFLYCLQFTVVDMYPSWPQNFHVARVVFQSLGCCWQTAPPLRQSRPYYPRAGMFSF